MNIIRLTASLFALALLAACGSGEGDDGSNAGGSSGSSTGGSAGSSTGDAADSSTGASGGSSTGGTGGSPSGGSGGSSVGGSSSGGLAGQDAGGTTDGGPDANADAGAGDSGSADSGQPGLNCAMPNDGLLAVFRVAGTEYFSAQITDPVGMQGAIDHCAEFGARYCPWAAELIELYDCRISGCPVVPK